MKRTLLLLVLAGLVIGSANAQRAAPDEFHVLVFSKTAGFRHSSIPDGIAAIVRLGDRHGFGVDATEDARIFSGDMLAKYDAVVFLSTTGDILDSSQEAALQQFVESGGGLVGVHAAADTEYDWAWYGQAMGGYFKSHPQNQTATIRVEDGSHPSTEHLGDTWERYDEWYNYRENPRGRVHVLMTLDESSYEGGDMGDDHPISWAQQVGGGRVWYTGLGHTEESFTEEAFMQHVLGGILWAAGRKGEDVGDAGPAEGTFEKVILNDDALNPMELAVAEDGRVFFVERAGTVRIIHPDDGRTTTAGHIPSRVTGENGMLGIALDPGFSTNRWLYLFYTVPDGEPRQRLSRFFLDGDVLDPESETALLEVPLTMGECCHSGGSLAFGPDGTLFISIGDETNPFASDGFNPIDERKGRDLWDAQRTSANTNDLRGGVIRIRPLADGTYEIPEGNLFPPGTANTRPEIFVMGTRNPFRISVDPLTGWLYWGDVGPDAGAPSDDRGAAGHDEFNQARGPGFYGWPYFTGDNKVYHDFDFASATPGAPFDPLAPRNDSPNNTGLTLLPPAEPALIWYPYGPAPEFPALEAGGRTAIAGPVYRADLVNPAPGALPRSMDGVLFLGEWQRNHLYVARLDAEGALQSVDRFLPETAFLRPMDMTIGPDGRFYLIEWGTTYGGDNPDAKIVRIDYRPSLATTNRVEGVAGASSESATPVRFDEPRSGSLVNDDLRISYSVSGPNGAAPGEVSVRIDYEVDGNAVASTTARGSRGELSLPRSEHPWPALRAERWVLTAQTDAGKSEPVLVYPSTIEAEHAHRIDGTTRSVTFDSRSNSTQAGVMLAPATSLAFERLDLSGASRIDVEVGPFASGTLEVRRDGPEGPVLGSAEISNDRLRDAMSDTASVAGWYRISYDERNLYVMVEVVDDDVQTSTEMASANDRIELYFDPGQEAGISYDDNDLRINIPIGQGPDGATSPQVGRPELDYAMELTADGYRVEVSVPWATVGVTPAEGTTLGFEINVGDVDQGASDRRIAWAANRNVAWSEPRVFGTLQLGGDEQRRRRGAFVRAMHASAAPMVDGQIDAVWDEVERIRIARQISLDGTPASLMHVRDVVSIPLEETGETVDLYLTFDAEMERGRILVDRLRLVR